MGSVSWNSSESRPLVQLTQAREQRGTAGACRGGAQTLQKIVKVAPRSCLRRASCGARVTLHGLLLKCEQVVVQRLRQRVTRFDQLLRKRRRTRAVRGSRRTLVPLPGASALRCRDTREIRQRAGAVAQARKLG